MHRLTFDPGQRRVLLLVDNIPLDKAAEQNSFGLCSYFPFPERRMPERKREKNKENWLNNFCRRLSFSLD